MRGMHAIQLFAEYSGYNLCRIQCVAGRQYDCLQRTMSTVCGMHVRQLLAAYNEYSLWHADNSIACSTQCVQFMACRQYSCLLNTHVTVWQLAIVTLFDESVQCFS